MTDEMDPSISLRTSRLKILSVGVVLLWGLIVVHLIGLHWTESQRMKSRVDQQQTLVETIRARPGDILDRNGQLLATSIDTESLYAVPRRIENFKSFAESIAPLVNRDPEELRQQLESQKEKGFFWLARRIDPQVADHIRAMDLSKETYGFDREFRRYYPNQALASHILGMRDIDGEGRGGMEQKYDQLLRGKDGKRTLVRDARNRAIHLYEHENERVEHGQTIHLTLDIQIQRFVEKQLDELMTEWQPIGCTAVICEPKSGDILAIASRPTYNPTDPTTFSDEAWLNRAVNWSYEPGSTMKPLVVAWALQQDLVSVNSRFHGHWGEYRMGPRVLHDTHAYGEMSLAEVLIKSSNIGMAQIGERMTNAGLHQALQQFGFGYRTGLGLPGELTGFVRPLNQWNHYSTGSIPMGQELTVTPLQMLMAHAALANRGEFQQPRLVLKAGHSTATEKSAQLAMPLIDPVLADWVIRDPMRRVLTEGTGQRVDVDGLDIFGKTGTSQVYDPELGTYSPTKTVCSFVCGIPTQNPELIVLVAVDQPTQGTSHYGSNVAAPAAVKMLKKAYGLRHTDVAQKPIAIQ